MSAEFERIVSELTSGGQLLPAERDIIMRAAERLGVDRQTANEIVETRLRDVGRATDGSQSCTGCGAPLGEADDACLFCKQPLRQEDRAVGRSARDDVGHHDLQDDAGDDGVDEEQDAIVIVPRLDDGMSSMFKIAGLLMGSSVVMFLLAKLFK